MRLLLRRVLAVVAAGAFAYSAWRVWGFVGQYRLSEIGDWLRAVPPERVFLAILFTAASYATLTGYDYLATRYAGHRLPYGKVALASFISIGVGYPLGPAPLGTGVLRYFFYSRLGLGLESFTRLALFIMATAILGKFSFAGLVLLWDPSTTAAWAGVGQGLVEAFAALSLAAVAAYLLLGLVWHRKLRLGTWTFAVPSLPVALAQVALGAANYFCIAAALHQLMAASAPISYATVATSYVFANFAVLLTHVPGGWGIMEFVVLSIVPQLDAVGALIAFRAIYYLAPLALGAALLVALEGARSLTPGGLLRRSNR